jgi:PAS domain-containing protein
MTRSWASAVWHFCGEGPNSAHFLKELQAQIAAAQDELTKRRRVEENLRASEEQFRLLADMSPVGIQSIDTEGNCQYVNPRWLE